MPATKLYHIMYLSHHCSLPRVWWTCLYIHKGRTEKAPPPPLQLPPCVPSSLFCNSSLPLSSLALVLVSNMSLSGITKVTMQLWALGTKYRSNLHHILSHLKDRFQHASHFVLSLCFQKSFLFPHGPFSFQLIPLSYLFSNLLQGKLWRHFHVLTNRLANPLVWIPLPCLQGPRNIMVTFILWPTQPPGSALNLFPTLLPLSKQVSSTFIVCVVVCTCQIPQPVDHMSYSTVWEEKKKWLISHSQFRFPIAHTVMRRFRKNLKSRHTMLWCLQIVNRG